MDKQLTQSQIEALEKQQYKVVGDHSSVKVCGWTKNMIVGKGECYKYKFYGIRSHQCLQMTSSMYCASRCKFCWRGEKAPVGKEWYGPVNEPNFIIDGSIKAHQLLVEGFNGNEKALPQMLKEMKDVKHVALSLTGEPINYPKLKELLKEFHKRKISTFLVTNAQFPEDIEKIDHITQFYISVDAPNKELLKEMDRPLFLDYYERLIKSLQIMKEKPWRSCIRITVVKGVTDTNIQGYKELIEKGMPDFIEVKGYMHVGASQKVLERHNMPLHEDIVKFSGKLNEALPDYDIIDDHAPSRVVCLMKKGSKRYIDFKKFFDITDNNKECKSEGYSSDTMQPNTF